MEPLDLLEQHVNELLQEVKVLRVENRKLREDALAGQHKVEEITMLQAHLAQEKKVREQALERVDAILRRIQEGMDEA